MFEFISSTVTSSLNSFFLGMKFVNFNCDMRTLDGRL